MHDIQYRYKALKNNPKQTNPTKTQTKRKRKKYTKNQNQQTNPTTGYVSKQCCLL